MSLIQVWRSEVGAKVVECIELQNPHGATTLEVNDVLDFNTTPMERACAPTSYISPTISGIGKDGRVKSNGGFRLNYADFIKASHEC